MCGVCVCVFCFQFHHSPVKTGAIGASCHYHVRTGLGGSLEGARLGTNQSPDFPPTLSKPKLLPTAAISNKPGPPFSLWVQPAA